MGCVQALCRATARRLVLAACSSPSVWAAHEAQFKQACSSSGRWRLEITLAHGHASSCAQGWLSGPGVSFFGAGGGDSGTVRRCGAVVPHVHARVDSDVECACLSG